MKILLVDDEVELVSAMAERLSFRGIDADWTDNGEDAMRMAAENEYAVAVLDMKMPKISGLELQEKLSGAHPNMHFIFLSGHGSESDFKAGCAAGCNYLIKPIDLEKLLEKIHEVTG
ncbi:Histidine kinase [Pseudodesulfovibrio profundus]|uniref:Histidine kinase n=1 Tax=Pseudodesulfovibrio profundus TaxID=57320 RepID=A0A2C8FDX2_9BACT|nr:response regulator [Pseudodesulfovibrio profundus]MBC16915.1 response regulator [Desulfovibrio sp.]SOB60365.1 Histidine kinase [Pseudodesulfovibrio profundus]|tara:strand:- start:13053 stop:13403 length:351 start_codon:yes stop_codon:yes gene_type:complete